MTLLHLPYTAWHLAYVVVGGCLVADGPVGTARAHGARVLPRAGHRRARARRARGPAAADARSRRACSSRSRSRSVAAACAIGLAVALGFSALAAAARRGRRLPRAGVQPGAVRRPLPHRPLVRARLGRLPGRHRLRRVRGDAPARRRCSPRRGRPSSRSRSGGSRPRCGDARREVVAVVAASSSCADGSRRAAHTRDCSSPRPRRRCGCSRSSTVLVAAALVAAQL